MKYYVVALFDKESYDNISPIQRNLSKKYRAHRNSPKPHILLEVLDNPNVDKLGSIIEKVIKPYKKFKIEPKDSIIFSESMRTLNLNIEDKGYIRRIARSLDDNLKLNGMNIKEDSSESLSISLANLSYIPKDNKKTTAENRTSNSSELKTYKISSVEIWKMSNNRRETPVKSFLLKDY